MSSEHYIRMLLSCGPYEALQWFLALWFYGILLHRVTVLAAVNLLLTILRLRDIGANSCTGDEFGSTGAQSIFRL